ncbi:protein POOR HOMOLOGOUS SYNAPSIS 1-like, partial [Rutidosis leptorrhynchoides]|uniref:protein POOR HOMOLOGOUS SYNAPSIS 1-like n=1 Tax=Rutidosis leptorrhynchoides TaxID=125765 RepID=UPI003A99589A
QGLQLSIMATTSGSIGELWEVQYARYFNCPSHSSSAVNHPSLVPPVNKFKGTWLSSFTSLADLKLLTSTDHSDTFRSLILTVNLLGNVIEEHYISNLHFTWPQVLCMSGYPPARGSKVVFMSYKDHVGQIQKFGVRFHSVDETESFVNLIKAIFGDEKLDGSISAISQLKTSHQSQIIPGSAQDLDQLTSTASCSQDVYRPLILDWTPQTSPADTYIQPVHPSENDDVSKNSNSQESTLSQDFQKLSAFPPSFTSLLMGCYPVSEQATQTTVTEKADLKNEILKYLKDSSFQDMLSKVQKVVSEFEDDLFL